jgi:hypothetical protein
MELSEDEPKNCVCVEGFRGIEKDSVLVGCSKCPDNCAECMFDTSIKCTKCKKVDNIF